VTFEINLSLNPSPRREGLRNRKSFYNINGFVKRRVEYNFCC
jgi:hypothetical protein